MTTKDYKLIARVLRNSFKRSITPSLGSFIRDLMYELKKDNPRFVKEKFLESAYEKDVL